MTVDHPLEMKSEWPDLGEACLADEALSVELVGVKRTTPGEVRICRGGIASFPLLGVRHSRKCLSLYKPHKYTHSL